MDGRDRMTDLQKNILSELYLHYVKYDNDNALSIDDLRNNLINNDAVNELCFAAQNAIIETIEYKLNACYKIIQNSNLRVQDFIICGGVFANLQARKMILNFSKENNLRIKEPLLKYSTDNAAMICMAAIEQIKLNNS